MVILTKVLENLSDDSENESEESAELMPALVDADDGAKIPMKGIGAVTPPGGKTSDGPLTVIKTFVTGAKKSKTPEDRSVCDSVQGWVTESLS